MLKLLSPLMVLMMISCSDVNSTQNPSEEAIITDTAFIDSIEDIESIDSVLWMGTQKFQVSEAADPVLNQGMNVENWPSEDSLLKLYPGVNRIGDSLIFETSKNGFIVLQDVPFGSDDDFNSAFYTLQGDVSGSDYWELLGIGYEFHWSILVSKSTGEMTTIYGRPVFSPNGDWLMTANVDLEAAFTDNGFELYACNEAKISIVGAVDPITWGPFSLKWISNDAILVTAGIINYENDFEMTYKNITLTMVKD